MTPMLDPDLASPLDGQNVLISFTLNRYIIDHLSRAMRHFDLDMESVLVWSLLAQLNVAHLITPGSCPDSVLDENGRLLKDGQEMRPLRLRDLSQISLLPRETVRRKLVKLEARGLVCRSGEGWTMERLQVDDKVRLFIQEQAQRAEAISKELSRILRCDGQPHS
ncbi:MAG: hypothetical protein DI584_04920 [Stenotrophomonas sp.]|nr:MAG: hypothetical protein DI584_04920 [Stenotrophomonas sp.]